MSRKHDTSKTAKGIKLGSTPKGGRYRLLVYILRGVGANEKGDEVKRGNREIGLRFKRGRVRTSCHQGEEKPRPILGQRRHRTSSIFCSLQKSEI